MNSENFGSIIDDVGNQAKKHLSLSDEEFKATGNHAESEDDLLGGSIDQNFSLNIVNGTGSVKESKRTWGVTLKGYFAIVSPSDGSWTVTVEINGKTVINQGGIVAGQKVPFTAKTKTFGETKFLIHCVWTEKKNTTLTAHLHASY